jgi:hypothetical protein
MFHFFRRRRAAAAEVGTDTGTIRIADMRRVDVRPGDRFVLTMASHISQEHYAAMQATWARFMPGSSLLILEPGARLGVIRGHVPAGDDPRAMPRVMTGAPAALAALDAETEAALAAETRTAPLDE